VVFHACGLPNVTKMNPAQLGEPVAGAADHVGVPLTGPVTVRFDEKF